MKFKHLVILITLFSTACNSMDVESIATNTPNFVTATLPPTFAPLPTQTLLPPSAVPTNPPIEGTTTTQINVRAETTTASASLGVVPAFSNVQIIGKESTENWFQVMYENQIGWVRAEFVQVDSSDNISVVEIESGGRPGRSGVVISGINVRSGAGINFESIGVLTQKDVVIVFGKDSSGKWLQIYFVDVLGWVASEFLQVENVEEIPVIESAQATPTVEAPSAVFQVAVLDGDTIESPLLKTVLIENRILQITGEVSTPQGDSEDWVEFSSEAEKFVIEISCSDEGLQLELWQNGIVWRQFSTPCNNLLFVKISVNTSYTLRIFQLLTSGNQYTSYRLKIKVSD